MAFLPQAFAFAALAEQGFEEGGVRKISLVSFFAREGRGDVTKKRPHLGEVVCGQPGASRNLRAPATCARRLAPGNRPAEGRGRLCESRRLGPGEPGTRPAEANSPMENQTKNQTENRPRGAGRARAERGPLPPCTSPSQARGRRFPPNCCWALPKRKDAAIFLLPAANAQG